MRFFFVSLTVCIGLTAFWNRVDAQWMQNNGLWGFQIRNVAVSDNVFFALTEYGVFRSGDNGTTWRRIESGLPKKYVYCLAAGGTAVFAGGYDGLFRSTDNGATWTKLDTTLTFVTWMEAAGSTIIAGTDSGNFISIDSGENWTEVDTSLDHQGIIHYAVSGSTVFAGGFKGVFRSTDNGTGWTSVLADKSITALGATDRIVCAGSSLDNKSEFCYSTDNGTHWTCDQNYGMNSFACYGDTIYVASGSRIVRSTDKGTSWIASDPSLTNVSNIAVSGSTIVNGTGSGVFISTNNGETWNATNSGLTNSNITSLAVCDNTIFAGTCDRIFISADNCISWTQTNPGNWLPTTFSLAVSGNTVFAGFNGGVSFSTDNGSTWVKPANAGLPDSLVNMDPVMRTYYDVTSLAVSDNTLFAVCKGCIFVSDDRGENWTDIHSRPGKRPVTSYAVKGDTLFAGTDSCGIFRTIDNGGGWDTLNSGLANRSVVSLFVCGGTIFAGTLGGLCRSIDDGGNWTSANSGLAGNVVVSFTGSGGALFAGTDSGGVFLSTDNGTSWSAVNSGLYTDFPVTSLVIHDGTLFAGSRIFGVWHRPLSEMPGTANVKPQRKLPDLMQRKIGAISHTGSTIAVAFTLPRSALVTIEMYDPAGKGISFLVNRRLDAGAYRYSWDTHAFAQGCYAVRLKAGATTSIKTIQILH